MFFFWDPRPKSQILIPHPCLPLLENFSLDILNSEQKPSAKNRSTGPVANRSTGRSTCRSTCRSTGDDFEIYRSGRVEKILTGSISDSDKTFCDNFLCLVASNKQKIQWTRIRRILRNVDHWKLLHKCRSSNSYRLTLSCDRIIQ